MHESRTEKYMVFILSILIIYNQAAGPEQGWQDSHLYGPS